MQEVYNHNLDDEENYFDTDDLFQFVLEGILLTIFSAVGVIGSLLALYVLLATIYEETFSKILVTLTSFDALFLTTLPFTFGFPLLSTYYKVNTT